MAMLVLTRNVGQEIVIGGDIILTVVGVQGGKIRLGITAPPNVRVDRREVHARRAEFAAGDEEAELVPDAPVVRRAH
jgi:carbon storage regulator